MDKKQLENLAREYAKIVASNMVVNRIILYGFHNKKSFEKV